MHDLRKQVLLESGKTVSRKAKLKVPSVAGSKSNSPAGSRAPSRIASRNTSDDDGENSDTTQFRYVLSLRLVDLSGSPMHILILLTYRVAPIL